MENIEHAAESLVDQAQRAQAFLGLTNANSGDLFFLVMGMTGAGKSTFVSQCTGSSATIGHGLSACTDSIDVFHFTQHGQRIHLIDTPGFNDTYRSDIDTLDLLATYLGASYANGVSIHGIIVLHPISDNRFSGSSMHNLRIIKAICGYVSYADLAIATTMWPEEPTPEEMTTLSDREAELLADDKFFGALVDQGATLFRYDQRAASAKRIVSYLKGQLGIQAPEPLQLQRELVDQQKTLGETSAGIAVNVDLYKARQAHALELHKLKLDLSNQLSAKDAAHAADLLELKAEILEKLKKDEDDAHKLKKTMEDMQQEAERSLQNKIKDLDEQFRDLLKYREQTLLDMEESLREISNDMARRSQQPVKALQVYKHREVVANAQEEVDQARLAYQKFQERTNQVINASINGVAAGVTTAVATTVLTGASICVLM